MDGDVDVEWGRWVDVEWGRCRVGRCGVDVEWGRCGVGSMSSGVDVDWMELLSHAEGSADFPKPGSFVQFGHSGIPLVVLILTKVLLN